MAKNKELELNAQPQALEAEQAVLGSMLTSKEAVSKAMQWVSAGQFYKDAHVRIFSCMVNLFEKGEPIDAISVVDRLKKKKGFRKRWGRLLYHWISRVRTYDCQC